jgi:Mg2+/Co2+ transporter CorB
LPTPIDIPKPHLLFCDAIVNASLCTTSLERLAEGLYAIILLLLLKLLSKLTFLLAYLFDIFSFLFGVKGGPYRT